MIDSFWSRLRSEISRGISESGHGCHISSPELRLWKTWVENIHPHILVDSGAGPKRYAVTYKSRYCFLDKVRLGSVRQQRRWANTEFDKLFFGNVRRYWRWTIHNTYLRSTKRPGEWCGMSSNLRWPWKTPRYTVCRGLTGINRPWRRSGWHLPDFLVSKVTPTLAVLGSPHTSCGLPRVTRQFCWRWGDLTVHWMNLVRSYVLHVASSLYVNLWQTTSLLMVSKV